jgi:hypothetical protein
VIRLINAYFVPVYTSMEDYVGPAAVASEEERRAYQNILRSAREKKLSTGTVHLYFVSPQGEALDSIHVAHAKPEKVIATLKATIEALGTPEGKPLVLPRPQAAWPKAAPDALALHLVARSVPGRAGGFWGELPGENFIVYARSEWLAFLPPEGAAPGARWEIDRAVALRLLNYFYPSTENNEISTNEVLEFSMKGTFLEAGRVRLDATLRMKHPFYHKKDEATVDAAAVGVVEFDPAGPRIRKFRMATERASYNGGTFGVAVSGPP